MQSGIQNHRSALWNQVRTAFRSNVNETDEAKVCEGCVLGTLSLQWRAFGTGTFIQYCQHAAEWDHSNLALCLLQIEEQKDA